MKTIKFGVIGCGLMGREFASAVARWCHLTEMKAKPEIIAVCDKNEAMLEWFTDALPTINQVTDDYQRILLDFFELISPQKFCNFVATKKINKYYNIT